MPQAHLESNNIRRILEGKQRAIIVPSIFTCEVGDIVVVRESFALENGTLYYRADDPTLPLDWRPSIFMKSEHVRLHLQVDSVVEKRISTLLMDEVLACGVSTTHELYKEWNSSLAKKDRPVLSSKLDPMIKIIRFENI